MKSKVGSDSLRVWIIFPLFTSCLVTLKAERKENVRKRGKRGFKCLGFEVLLGCQVSLSTAAAGNPHWDPHVLYLGSTHTHPHWDPHTRFIFASLRWEEISNIASWNKIIGTWIENYNLATDTELHTHVLYLPSVRHCQVGEPSVLISREIKSLKLGFKIRFWQMTLESTHTFYICLGKPTLLSWDPHTSILRKYLLK